MADQAQSDQRWMLRAVGAAEAVRGRTSPNPWVGAAIVPPALVELDAIDAGDTGWFTGASAPPGGPHAEVQALEALAAAHQSAERATMYVTLEPCAHVGRTPPCTEAIIASGVRRVVVGVEDPDPQVSGRGVDALRAGGVEVVVGVGAAAVNDQLAAYLKHRRTGRPYVVLKLAVTLDGRTAAPDGSSRWITGAEARRDAHRLRARSDAVMVGAGTIRADDPSLTVRLPDEDPLYRGPDEQPLRVVLGRASPTAAVHPALELHGPLGTVLDTLGQRGVVQLLVEGGARVAHDLQAQRLVDRYVLYLAPALFGGDDARAMFAGPGAGRLDDMWRGRVHSVTTLGGDLRVELAREGHRHGGHESVEGD